MAVITLFKTAIKIRLHVIELQIYQCTTYLARRLLHIVCYSCFCLVMLLGNTVVTAHAHMRINTN